MKLKFISAFVVISSYAATARAEILLEPYLGYSSGKWEQGTSDQDVTGLGYGARIGSQMTGLMFGADYMTASWKDNSTPIKNDITPSILGAFIGFKFPTIVRVWAMYAPEIFNPSVKFSAGSTTTKYEGTALKFGIGFSIAPLVSLNFEMLNSTYDEANGQNMTNDLKVNVYTLGVSLPFTL